MEIINALKAKKLNSQITCTSYYDFLTKERHGPAPLNCMDMQRNPPSETVREDPLGSARDRPRYYDVDDNATEWYLGTRALPVKNSLDWQHKICSNYRRRRLKTTSYSVLERRVSPEFLSLLKQHHARTRRHLPWKYRRPKVSFAYYKYDAEGKRRHMRPGIDTAAPLEFLDPMDQDELQVPEQEMYIDPSVPLSPGSKRSNKPMVRPNRHTVNKDKDTNAKDLMWFKVDGLEFPSATEEVQEDLDNKDNSQENKKAEISAPKPSNVCEPSNLRTLAERLARRTCPFGLGVVPSIRYGWKKKDRDSRLLDFVKAAFVKAFHGWEVYPKKRSSKQSRHSQCPSDGNISTDNCEQNGTVCKKPSINRSKGTDPTNKTSKGILKKRRSFDLNFNQNKLCTANCKYRKHKTLPKSNPYGSNLNPRITGQEELRIAEEEKDQPNFSGNSPDNSERPFPCKGNVAESSSGRHCGTKSKKKKVEFHCNSRAVQGPTFNSEIQHTSEAQQRIHPEEDPNFLDFHEENTCKCLSETDQYGSEMSARLAEIKKENCLEHRHPTLCYFSVGSSCGRSVSKPKSGYHLNTNQSNGNNLLTSRQMECKKMNTEIRNACPKTYYKYSWFRQDTSKCATQKELRHRNLNMCKMNPEITGQESRLSKRENKCPNFSSNKPSSSRTIPVSAPVPAAVPEPRSYLQLKAIQSMNKHQYDPPNSMDEEKPPVPLIVDPISNNGINCYIKKISVKPPVTEKVIKKCETMRPKDPKISQKNYCLKPTEKLKRCKNKPKDPKVNQKHCCLEPTENLKRCQNKPKIPKMCQKNCCLELPANLKRCPNKPIPIRCNPETKKCVPFPHSSGNERTDFLQWLYPNSGKKKRYTKTRKTPSKGGRPTRKCTQSDTSLSCDPSRMQQYCRCPCCSSVVPSLAFRGQGTCQRSCPHRKRWHCKQTCQENSQGSFPWSCEQTKSAPTDSKKFTRCCLSERMRGGVDLQENNYYIPGRNRDVAHSFSTNLFSDSDSYQQSKYARPRRSMHAFRFD